ncbi:sensor histidine kinase [Clostridium tyrobutyricum]|uniref:sensor histidine kinase n=1 Tax=Clostridium tyrobutyricum TaxID=1519 RepID=UPI001C38FF1A|nr:sensor histidine kinase [Clostridium tyrobutyricum]
MKNIFKIWRIAKPIIRYLILFYMMFNILSYAGTRQTISIVCAILNGILILVTFIYLTYMQDRKNYSRFLIISILLFMTIWIIDRSINIYYFIILDDIFDICEFRTRIKFLLFHFTGFILYVIMYKPLIHNLNHIMYYIVAYILTLMIFVIIHNYRYERDKLKVLNSNLIEYSFKEREYVVMEERERISQELHDSIGHSLMALSMNIRYLKALKDKEKIQSEICEIDKLVKESIKTLRTTVYDLKKLDGEVDIQDEIEKIAEKFNKLDIVKIIFSCKIDTGILSGKVQEVLITTVKEAITNSLKHGSPSIIYISIEIRDYRLHMEIKDNGEGCKFIRRSNGLNGIVKRIHKINGEVNFISIVNRGFTIEISIPEGFSSD